VDTAEIVTYRCVCMLLVFPKISTRTPSSTFHEDTFPNKLRKLSNTILLLYYTILILYYTTTTTTEIVTYHTILVTNVDIAIERYIDREIEREKKV
jgi:hypothetical protein